MTAVPMSTVRRTPPSRRTGELLVSRKTLASWFIVACLWLPIPFLSHDYRVVAAPVSAILSVSVLFLFTIWRWNGTLPVFELGSLFGLIATLYAAVPNISFLAGGLQWTLLSDGRLQYYQPGPAEMGEFTWPYVPFLAAFAIAYLIVRPRHAKLERVEPPQRSTIIAAVVLFIGLQIILKGFELAAGINFDPTYVGGGLSTFSAYYALPYFVQQILHNLVGWRLTLKVILGAILMTRWKTSRFWRWTLILGLGLEVMGMITTMGARTYTALLVLGMILLYHRMVRPLTFRMAGIGALILVGGLTLYSSVRTIDGTFAGLMSVDRRIWTATTDFQTMFTSAWIVQLYKEMDLITEPPWQVHFIDLILLIPSQFLPFDKIDPSGWFYAQLGTSQSSMFGLRAQPVIGFGTLEFTIRGLILGLFFGFVHLWYVNRSGSFWVVVCYAYACIWSHYIFRSTMLWPTYFIVYQFIPVMIVIRSGAALLRQAQRLPRLLPRGGAR